MTPRDLFLFHISAVIVSLTVLVLIAIKDKR